jgi:hypothetical protein
MRKTLPLVITGVVAVILGVLGAVALASSLVGSSADAARSADAENLQSVPGVYGTK